MTGLDRRVADRTGRMASLVVGAVTAATAWPVVYLGVLTVVGLPRGRQRADDENRPVAHFAIMVPAHDEAMGIGATLRSFRDLDYPVGSFSVHVVADNCSDETARVVRSAGWVAHERTDPDHPGKGPALNWLYDRLVVSGECFDAIVVVDADTSLDPGFLSAMNSAYQRGAAAAQGQYSVRDPADSVSASFRYAALACRHHLRPLARSRLGASSGLYGNGMMFRRSVMTGRRWTGHLVEDAEFQLGLLLDGDRVAYVPDAVLWAEMPHETGPATSQNERWERGRLDLAREYGPTLIRRLATARTRRGALADAVIDVAVPPVSVLVAAVGASTAISAIGTVGGRPAGRRLLAVNLTALATVVVHVVAGLVSVRAPAGVYRNLLGFPRIALWKVRLWWSVVVTSDDVAWTRTRRNDETAP